MTWRNLAACHDRRPARRLAPHDDSRREGRARAPERTPSSIFAAARSSLKKRERAPLFSIGGVLVVWKTLKETLLRDNRTQGTSWQ
jgi:hypothetical protein